jgi:hypothetical protein
MIITFSSCFYIIKSKFEASIYIEWMNNFISIVNNFYLVIYTDENSSKYIDTKNNSKIKIIIKPLEKFYNYKYKEFWIKNHEKNFTLNDKSSWELNMLWSEKIWFVKESIERKYFDSDLYGWCDIGYFRNRKGDYTDLNTQFLSNWPSTNKILNLDKQKIVYGCINNSITNIQYLIKLINKKNNIGLPIQPIPTIQQSISGGFFIIEKNKIDWWSNTYEEKLKLYFENNYLVKDDQIILADCIFTNPDNFSLFRENNYPYDNWFMFQRILL